MFLTLCDPRDCSLPGSSGPWDSPDKNTGVGCHALLQGIFPAQGSNPGLPHCRWIPYRLNPSVWIGHRYTCVPSILNAPHLSPHPTPRLSQSTSFGCPEACRKLTLAIYFTYGNVNASMLFFQIIPPSPPTESKNLFFMFVSPFLPWT